MDAVYWWLQSLHTLGATVFLGALLVTLVARYRAEQSGDGALAAFALDLAGFSDRALILPAAVLLVLSGAVMARVTGGAEFWHVPWLAWGVGLFGAALLAWAAVMVPVRRRQAALLAASSGPGHARYRVLGRLWLAAATVILLLGLINLWVMVFKPG